MNKQTKTILAILGVGGIAYLIYRNIKRNKCDFSLKNQYYKYKVVNDTNLVDSPSSANVLKTKEIGKIIALRPSSYSGWLEYTQDVDAGSVDGYILSSDVVKCDSVLCKGVQQSEANGYANCK